MNQQKDTRHEVKVGDYFNIVKEPSGKSEIWDNQNRFSTCKLVRVEPNGRWVYKELWYEYAKNDYPFLSSETFWNVMEVPNILVYKIQDPEKEGFKHTKAYLPELIEKRIEALKEKINKVDYRIVRALVVDKKDAEVSESLEERLNLVNSLKQYDIEASANTIIVDFKVPFVSFMCDGKKITGTIKALDTTSYTFNLESNRNRYPVKLSDLLGNDDLFPIDFAVEYPWDSILRKSEDESAVCFILYNTESWDKPLTYEEYKKAGGGRSRDDFEYVAKLIDTPEKCAKFSKSWLEIYTKNKANK